MGRNTGGIEFCIYLAKFFYYLNFDFACVQYYIFFNCIVLAHCLLEFIKRFTLVYEGSFFFLININIGPQLCASFKVWSTVYSSLTSLLYMKMLKEKQSI